MKNLGLFILAVFCIFVFVDKASAQISSNACPTNSNGEIIGLGDNGRCYMPAENFRFVMSTFALCEGFPQFGNGLENCISNNIEETTIDITEGSEVPLEGSIPPPGTYDHMILIISNRTRVQGQVKFADSLNVFARGSDGNALQGGLYCKPPSIEQRTSDFFLNRSPWEVTWINGVTQVVSMTSCSTTEFADTSDSAEYIFDQLSSSSVFGSRKSDSGFVVDPSARVNAVLLNDEDSEATSRDNASKFLLIIKDDVVVPEGADTVRYQFEMNEGINIWSTSGTGTNHILAINIGNTKFRAIYE